MSGVIIIELPQMAVRSSRDDPLGTGSHRAALSGIFTVLALPKKCGVRGQNFVYRYNKLIGNVLYNGELHLNA